MNIISVLSYNIWFDNLMKNERTFSLIDLICSENPDVICLQEVRQEIYELLIKHLPNYKYYFPKKIINNYGCVTFSKYPISKCSDFEFKNSSMGRSLIVTKIDFPFHNKEEDGISIDKLDIVIANTHFESLFKKATINTEKLEQYEQAQKILESLYKTFKNVIFCSDTNVLAQEEEKFNEIYEDNEWNDAWTLKGSELEKFTYDSEKNIFLSFKLFKVKYKSRIDRILFKSDNCVIEEFNLIKAKQNCTEPSDHFGIYAKFVIV